jgi:hypothetical protein
MMLTFSVLSMRVGWLNWTTLVRTFSYKILLSNSFSGINYWLKSKLLANTEPGEFNQFWLGATTEVRHLNKTWSPS